MLINFKAVFCDVNDDFYLKVIYNVADFSYLLNLLGYMLCAVDDAYLFGYLLDLFG